MSQAHPANSRALWLAPCLPAVHLRRRMHLILNTVQCTQYSTVSFRVMKFALYCRMSSSEAQASNLLFSRALKDVAAGSGRDRASASARGSSDRPRVSVVPPLPARPPSSSSRYQPSAAAATDTAAAGGGVPLLQLDAAAVLGTGGSVPLVSANIGGVTGLFALTPISSLGGLIPSGPPAAATASASLSISSSSSSAAQLQPLASIASDSGLRSTAAIPPSKAAAAAAAATLASPYVRAGGGLSSGITISFNPAELPQHQQQQTQNTSLLERQQYASGYGVPPADDADQLFVGDADAEGSTAPAPSLPLAATSLRRSSAGATQGAQATRFIVTIEGAPSLMKQAVSSRAAKRAQAQAQAQAQAAAATGAVSASGQRISAKERLGTLKRRGGISLQGKQAPSESDPKSTTSQQQAKVPYHIIT